MDHAGRKRQDLKPYLLLVLAIGAILYGSLYPFIFRFSDDGHAAIAHLLGTWRDPPQSRGDLIANILLYVPLGLVGAMAAPRTAFGMWGLILSLGTGMLLSFTVESVQFYDASRVSCMSDFYLNVLGSSCGWSLSRTRIVRFASGDWPQETTAIFARLLLATWLAWRLYPYVPVIDMHKYWRSLKPLALTFNLDPYEVYRFTILWLAAGFLLWVGIRPKRPIVIFQIGVLGMLVAKILIVDLVITSPEVCGAIIAIGVIHLVMRHPRSGGRLLALSFLVVVVANRILPWDFSAISRPFEWFPFFSFLHGSLEVDVMSFLEKFFLYGTLLLLLTEGGLSLVLAGAIEAMVLLITSALETHLPNRSGEITDALMVLVIAVVYALIKRGPVKTLGSSSEEAGQAV